jgi:phospholipid/cholesterol/gamma-HCH transport system substrate-binding protein/paraquat-inducible protein B
MVTRLSTTIDHANKSLRRVDTVLASRSQDVEELVENLRVVSEQLRQVTKNVERYPAQVLFGEPPPHAKTLKR